MEFHELDLKAVRLTMASVLLAIFMGSLDQTIVATAMPAIVKSLNGFNNYSGVISAYLITSTIALPIGGKLSDIYGRKRFLMGGFIWFIFASVLCGLSRSMTELILFRAMKGLGNGIMQSAANTTIADLYPPARRGKAIGLVSTVSVLASVIGPLLGGYLTDGFGWRYVFFINLPVGIAGCIVAALYFPHIVREQVKNFKIDYAGALTMIAGVVPILLALHNVGEKIEWLSFPVAGLLAIGIFFIGLFVAIEKKASHPLVPIQIFKDPIISISLLNSGLAMAAMLGVSFFVPLFLQSVLGLSAKQSGATLLPLSFTFAIVATITGHLVGRFNRYRMLALVGSFIMICGAFLLAMITQATPSLIILMFTVLTGFGLAMCAPIYNIAVQNAAPLNVLGVATSMVYFTRSIFSSIGVAVYGTILSTRTLSVGLPTALCDIFGLISVFALVIFIATLFLKEIPLRKSNAVTPAKV